MVEEDEDEDEEENVPREEEEHADADHLHHDDAEKAELAVARHGISRGRSIQRLAPLLPFEDEAHAVLVEEGKQSGGKEGGKQYGH